MKTLEHFSYHSEQVQREKDKPDVMWLTLKMEKVSNHWNDIQWMEN